MNGPAGSHRTRAGTRGIEGSLIGLAIVFFTLAGSQGEPRPLEVFGLILITPLVLVGTGLTRRPWIAALYLLLFGVLIRVYYLDRPLDSDVLPVTDAAIDRLLAGGNPYGPKYSVLPFLGPGNPYPYPPGNLLYYLPGFLYDSVRSTEVFSAGLVLAGLAWAAWLNRNDWPVATMGVYAAAPPLILLATDGSNDTSAGALLFASALLLFVSRRQSNGWLLFLSALVMGETLAFKQYTLPFWPFLVSYLAAQPWSVRVPIGPNRPLSTPAWLLYMVASGAYVGAVGLPFFLASPSAFIDSITHLNRAIEGWNVWSFLLHWQAWDARVELGDRLLVAISVGIMGVGVASSLLVDVTRPSRALLFGAGLWFLVMLFARWTTYAYFAGVAPVVLLIPFADRLVEIPEVQVAEKGRGAAGLSPPTTVLQQE